jgi:hypothetical protein
MSNWSDNSTANPIVDLRKWADYIYRDFGRYGKHSSRCVYINSYIKGNSKIEWCCSNDCEMK